MVRLEESPFVRQYFNAYGKLAESQCAPIFWPKPDGSLEGGSMTFLRTESTVLGLTNKHVAEGLESRISEDPSTVLRLGAAPFDTSRLIAKHPDLDLATYDIGEILLNNTLKHTAAAVCSWPVPVPNENSYLMLGGWPGGSERWAHNDANQSVTCTFSWIAGRINGTPGRYVSIEFDPDESTAISSKAMGAGFDLGGWSGGGVYRYYGEADAVMIEYIELCGIICEAFANGFIRAHDLSTLNPDGTFNELGY